MGKRKLVTFDIFDTLISRKCGKPQNVFFMVYEKLPSECVSFLGSDAPDKFVHLRISSESWLLQQFVNSDITLLQIWTLMYEKGLPIDPVKGSELEMSIELSQCVRHPHGSILFERYSRVADIAYISDMYLPKSCIEEILLHAGYDTEANKLFVSCEVGQTKSSGKLFSYVKNHYPDHSWEHHIGDNYHSDVMQASGFARKTVHFNPPSPEAIESNSENGQSEELPDKSSTLVVRLLGPVLMAYAIWLERRRQEKQLKCLVFMARDCNLLIDVYKDVMEHSSCQVESKYAEMSRTVLAPLIIEAASDGPEYLFGIWEEKSISKLASKYPFIDWSSEKNTNFDSYPASGINLGNNGTVRMSADAARLSSRTKRYFGNLVRNHSEVGIVDLGWYMNAQQSLKAVKGIEVHGFYLCTKRGYNLNVEPRKYNSLFFEHDDLADVLIGHGTALEHILALSSVGSTVDYDENLNPVFGANCMNVNCEVVDKLRSELKSYVSENISNYSNLSDQELRVHISDVLNRFLLCPLKQDIQLFSELTIGLNQSESIPLVASIVKLNGFIPTYRETFWYSASKRVTHPILLMYWQFSRWLVRGIKLRRKFVIDKLGWLTGMRLTQ